MILLEPTDRELDWAAVEASLTADALSAEAEWRLARLLMPDDAADGMKLDAMAEILAQTALALNIPAREIYQARHRIRWMTFTDGPGFDWPTFATLDGGAPMTLKPEPTPK